MKKHLAFILAILMLSGCGNAGTEETETVLDTESAAQTETETEITDALPERDYGGTDYVILTAAEQWAHTYYAEELSGDTLNDAIYTRNGETEERFGVKLNYEIVNGYSAGMSVVTDKLRGAVMGGDGVYDLLVANICYCADNIIAGLFQDQIPMEYLDFDSPWYYQDANKNITIGGRLFASAGAFGLASMRDNPCVVFNKKLMTDLGHDMPYETVLDGKWTWDLMYSMASEAVSDLNGDGVMDAADRFGILSTSTEAVRLLTFGMGYTVTDFDAEGTPYYVGATEHNVDVISRMQELLQDKSTVWYTETDPIVDVIPMFVADKGLFCVYPLRLVEYEEMREAEDFGIIPLPKYDEAQEYYTNSAFKDIAAVPTIVKDVEMSQIILEALNCATFRDVNPSYYDIVLQRKMSRDAESAAMIDIITATGTMDVNMAFYFTLTISLYAVDQINGNFSTWWAANQKSVEAKLDNLMDTLTELPS